MFTLHNPTKLEDLSGYFVTSNACPMCDVRVTITVTPEQLFAYNQGSMAHQVLADYPDYVREQFISGYCDDCWKDIFGEDE